MFPKWHEKIMRTILWLVFAGIPSIYVLGALVLFLGDKGVIENTQFYASKLVWWGIVPLFFGGVPALILLFIIGGFLPEQQSQLGSRGAPSRTSKQKAALIMKVVKGDAVAFVIGLLLLIYFWHIANDRNLLGFGLVLLAFCWLLIYFLFMAIVSDDTYGNIECFTCYNTNQLYAQDIDDYHDTTLGITDRWPDSIESHEDLMLPRHNELMYNATLDPCDNW